MAQYNYKAAKESGISDEEILSELTSKYPKYNAKKAQESGLSIQEINEYLSSYKPQKSNLEKGTRIAGQFALGLAENALLPYELSTAPLASKEAMNVPYREGLGDELEFLMDKKAAGQWTPEDQEHYDHIAEQIKDPRKSMEFAKTLNMGVRDIAEKVTGQDLHPEGALEKAANWIGFIKNPKNAKELFKMGTSPKGLLNNIMPGGKDVMRGLTAGTALEMAEQNQFGPMGIMAAAVVGDLMGAGTAGLAKAITSPKQTLAKGAALLSNTKSAIKSDLKEAAQGTEFTKDIGTLTNNNMVQMIQARLSASGLTGKPLQELRKKMTQETIAEYESIAKELRTFRFGSLHEAGEVAKEGLRKIRDSDKAVARELYQSANKSIKKGGFVDAKRLETAINNLESELRPGSIKSTEQKLVLDKLNDLKSNIYDEGNNLRPVPVKDLMNNKIALNDIINYEVQGGTKQLLKDIVKELDRTIISHGKENPEFAKNYINANKKFSEHAKTFRKKNIEQLLNLENPEQLMNRMNNVQGIRDLQKVLSRTPEGKNIFNGLAREKLDVMIGDNMKDGITEQIKFGKLHSIIKDPKNREILKEILPPQSYKKIIGLQKHAGELAETAQKFFNASQSATAGADMAIVGALFSGLTSLLTGNPWALHAIGMFGVAKQVSKLIADPEFLKMTEEAIKVARKNDVSAMKEISNRIISHVGRDFGPSLLASKTLQEEEVEHKQ